MLIKTPPFYFLTSLVLTSFVMSCSSTTLIKTQNRGDYKKIPHANSQDHTEPSLHQSSEFDSALLKQTNTTSTITASSGVIAASLPIQPNAVINTKIKHEVIEKPISNKSFSTDFKKIGALLPLTGKSAALGQRALSAIRLGLGINANSDYSLALFDTQSNPDLAAQGVEKLLAVDHVIAILGGLGAKEATSIAEKAEFFQVPFFTFSQKSDLTVDAKYTFRNSVTPAMQSSKLVEFATQKLGLKKFAILYPNDAYGVEFANQFWDHVLAYGGSIVAAQVYDPKDVDLTVYIQKMVGTFYPDSRMDEYKNKVELIKEKNKEKLLSNKKKNSRENNTKENILDPIIDFDAIFIPDSSKSMGQAIGFFRAADVSQMIYLGTNLWNTEDLARRANQTAANNGNHFYFVDNVITDEQRKKSDFNSQFINAFKEEPSIIEVQTYESAKIIRDSISSGARDRYSLANRIKELGHRSGAFSEIYMNNSNEIVRDLSVLSLDNGLITPQ